MITDINETNQDAIMGVMRSVCVCLNILLTKNDTVAKLSSHTSHFRMVVDSREALIENIAEILTEDRFSAFIHSVLHDLDMENVQLFNERHAIVMQLPAKSKSMVRELMDSLKNCEDRFISKLWGLMDSENEITHAHCGTLLELMSDSAVDNTANANATDGCGNYGSSTYDRIYRGGYTWTYAGDQYGRAYYEEGYAYLWGSYVYGNESPEEREIISRRLRVNQTFKRGIRNNRMIVWKFKDANTRFTLAETDAILAEANDAPGTDLDEKIFRGAAHHMTRDVSTFRKLIMA